ncbi:hypothetical protein M5W83_26635 [Paenibacillus thiaminolyticus]|uniref:Uncharacterized protein n=1 Tax=Paenibacillus thiaminolyticus TaxID=49283 RepID=A0AAP9DS80_PANTH|nr:hypothetical protein [Paenibacillus thiaminolyticus]MCY9535535.1 hypothetical protein [Paenibacillus thiaminolyticus]MCY9601692.1 hypothetical protein [Paenibacillus thiaminolyticus]MCY9610729.1 hypothetical protein [Paenibacillus thiaminolyticus]MCY9615858.1 hypothetical protein [Paenibacillus thiaminolyticus]MCY9622139.1 hypothetical protein [Paenibacillus thiaminolyticus]
MNTEEFENWVSIHNIIERTKKGFWNYMENYKQEEPDEFSEVFGNVDMNFLETNISKISLTINYTFDEPIKFVSAFIDVEYEGEELGVYQCLFSLDGDDLDDYLTQLS